MNIQPSRDYDLNQKITELLQARIDHHWVCIFRNLLLYREGTKKMITDVQGRGKIEPDSDQ
jgi:hypothetical protein